MTTIDLFIFDLDGTLVDSEEAIIKSVNLSLREIGLDEKKGEEIKRYIGSGVEDLIRKSIGSKNERLFNKALTAYNKYFTELSKKSTKLFNGVKNTLEYFKDKEKAVITNRPYDSADQSLKELGIRHYFSKIMGGDDLGCMKPSSCPLDKAMHELNIKDKKKTMIVGDMDIDILAGREAGIITCAVLYGIGNRGDIIKLKPDYVIEDMRELKQIVSK